MKHLFILLICLTPLMSCNKDKNCCSVMSLDVTLAVKTANNVDLLNPENPNAFNLQSINLYYFENGSFVKIDDPTKDLPQNLQIYKGADSDYNLKLFVNANTDVNGTSLTVIKFGQSVPDTIRAVLQRNNTSVIIKSGTINGLAIDRSKPFLLIK